MGRGGDVGVHLECTKINSNSIFKTNLLFWFWGVLKPRWAELVGCTVNACMHVDTGTDHDLVSHFVGPQSGDKEHSGNCKLSQQGSQQDYKKKMVCPFTNNHSEWPFWMHTSLNWGEYGPRTKENPVTSSQAHDAPDFCCMEMINKYFNT